MKFAALIKSIKEAALDLLYPRRAVCMGCGSMLGCDRDDLCETCRAKLAGNWVGARTVDPKLKLDGAAFAYSYQGTAGSLVRRLKYSSVTVLSEMMAKDIARAVQVLRMEQDVLLTAVPMHPKRRRKRGMNHAEILARSAAQMLNMEYSELLMRTRNAPQQARLSHEQRRTNLRGGFAVRPEWQEAIRGARVLVIDDVFTTGATARACAEALRQAGAKRVYFVAYAYGERKKHG